MKDHYKLMGHIYDLLSNLYSGWRIPSCKEAMLDAVRPDDKVLFAGVGHGREAVKAAELGAAVTVVDLSETMLQKFEKACESTECRHPVVKLHENIFNVNSRNAYDFVFANFFLNVFKRHQMDQVVAHLSTLVKPGGHLVVGDFAHPTGGRFERNFQRIYWSIAVTPFFLFTNNAVHPIYNYPLYLKKHGLTVERVKYFKLLGQRCYWSIAARK